MVPHAARYLVVKDLRYDSLLNYVAQRRRVYLVRLDPGFSAKENEPYFGASNLQRLILRFPMRCTSFHLLPTLLAIVTEIPSCQLPTPSHLLTNDLKTPMLEFAQMTQDHRTELLTLFAIP
jgi:hypothetical protein